MGERSFRSCKKCTRFCNHSDEFGIAWNDPRLAIDWPVDEPLLSAKAAAAPALDEIEELLPFSSGRDSKSCSVRICLSPFFQKVVSFIAIADPKRKM